MVLAYEQGTYANHASNLGALLGQDLAPQWDAPVYVVDPVTTDDFIPLARISGVPGIERKSRSHALNIRHCFHRFCRDHNLDPDNTRVITAHLGGGFSIAAVVGGKIIDTNDALLGMGPFSVERAGALPLAGFMDLIYDRKMTRAEVERILTKKSGQAGYLGTNDLREVETRVANGDEKAQLIYEAMIYQITKEIGGLYATFGGDLSGLILTGGLIRSPRFTENITANFPFISPIQIYPGSFELEALAAGVYRVLTGRETAREYA